MVKFRGVRIMDKEIVYDKGEGSGVGVIWWRKSMGVEVSEKPYWVRTATRRSWDNRPDWGRPGTVFRTSHKRKGLPWEWRRKGRRPSLVRVGREIDDTSMRTDLGEGRVAPR